VPDLHGWITQQIDTTQQRADRWHDTECDVHDTTLIDAAVLQSATLCDCGGPASVLRRCAADRKILEHHSPVGGGWPGHYVCAGCGYDGGYCPEPYTEHVNDCPTLLALSEGYGLAEEQRALLDRPQVEQPPRRPGFGGIPDVLVERMLRVSLSTVPVALRGPNWKA
jgi:hypothetical protein